MKHATDFMTAIADFDQLPGTVIWRAGSPTFVTPAGDRIAIEIPFSPYSLQQGLQPCKELKSQLITLYLELWGDSIVRLTQNTDTAESPMLDISEALTLQSLMVSEGDTAWTIKDIHGRVRAVFQKKSTPETGWSQLITPSFDSLCCELFPDTTAITFSTYDQFFPEKVESLPLACIAPEGNLDPAGSYVFSLTTQYQEHFAGTGERFAPMDLRGSSPLLENTDALGVNSRRAYKNVPFFLSSAGYGVFIHTSATVQLSLADISTRAAQGRVELGPIDLFFIGGGTPEKVLYQYRRLTGFPPAVPLWSLGIWMSRMTYFSAAEIEEIAARLREEEYPCDVIHIDTGWFEHDWVCEWKFSKERFPDPGRFMRKLAEKGFKVSLWQTPNIGKDNCLFDEAVAKRYLAPQKEGALHTASDFSGQDFGGQIDFTNPEAVAWYKEKLRGLFELGAAVIKTDFGEKIDMSADYMHMPAAKLHNVYALLYQRSAYEETLANRGEALIWARAGWAGCQRYPVHWGGDAAATWEGMAGSLRGGLHLGLSGFGYWSHDVPGFHALPEFMNSPISDTLYLRWTQMAVFTSHMRYHGTSPREPWYFPGIADLIRKWFRIRYTLMPYLYEQALKLTDTGYPFLRAMLLHYPEDQTCWHIDDQFFCGESLLVCPVMNDSGIRAVYLPEGKWVDIWTGSLYAGNRWYNNWFSPIDTLPVFCLEGTELPVYGEFVASTQEMDISKTQRMSVDKSFAEFLANI